MFAASLSCTVYLPPPDPPSPYLPPPPPPGHADTDHSDDAEF
jgi:hypothetical protein